MNIKYTIFIFGLHLRYFTIFLYSQSVQTYNSDCVVFTIHINLFFNSVFIINLFISLLYPNAGKRPPNLPRISVYGNIRPIFSKDVKVVPPSPSRSAVISASKIITSDEKKYRKLYLLEIKQTICETVTRRSTSTRVCDS